MGGVKPGEVVHRVAGWDDEELKAGFKKMREREWKESRQTDCRV